jgi:peptidyl-prolyl cis-trans isomerase C
MDFKRIPVTVAALLLCTLPACSTVGGKAAPNTSLAEQKAAATQPVEKVNGAVITRAEVDRTVKALVAQSRMTPTPDLMKQAEEAALTQLTSSELLYQEASKVEIKDLDRLVTEKVAEGKAKFPSEAEFQKSFQASGLTMDQVRETVRKQLVINNFIETRFKETVSDEETKKFYDQNVEKYFKKGERVKASHILVGVDKTATAEEKLKAKEKAEALLKRVQGGEDFAAIAKKESTCSSAARGGDLGIFGKGVMTPIFEKTAFALNKGELSSVVETPFGYHIIKLEDKLAAGTEKYEEVKEKIADFLKGEKIKKAIAQLVQELRSKAKIEKV